MTWRVFNLQLAWFGQSVQSAAEIFQRLADHQPVNASTSTTPIGAMSNASGQIQTYDVNIAVQPSRTDMVLSQMEQRPPEQQNGPLPIIEIDHALAVLRKAVEDLEIPSVNRFGLVANVSQIVDSMEEVGIATLGSIGLDLPFGDVSDVLFKINRRTSIPSVSGLLINRVMTWQPEIFQRMQVQMPAFGGGSLMAAPILGQAHHAVTVNVDINTVLEAKRTFTKPELRSIFTAMNTELLRLSASPTPSALADA